MLQLELKNEYIDLERMTLLNDTNNFVASVYNNHPSLQVECPKACRPQEHQDWKYC